MALRQSLQTVGQCTFGDVAEMVLKSIVTPQRCQGKRIDFVTDCYRDLSIKSCERKRRSQHDGIQCLVSCS